MKLEELKKLEKGTPIISYTKEHFYEGTFEGLVKTLSFGYCKTIDEAIKAFSEGKGRKQTEVVIKVDGVRHHVSPRSVIVIRKKVK